MPALQTKINGVKQDLSGVTGVLQQKLTEGNQLVTSLKASRKQLVSLPS